jgi:hypothetical protein
VHDLEPRIGDVAEYILGEERRGNEEQEMQRGDHADREPGTDAACRQQHHRIYEQRQP